MSKKIKVGIIDLKINNIFSIFKAMQLQVIIQM